MEIIDLLDHATTESQNQPLDSVRLSQNETGMIFFTSTTARLKVHYCEEPELMSYVACNHPECVLCGIGRVPDTRLLIPVYLPLSGTIGVLAISDSHRPGALYPLVLNILKSKEPVIAFVKRQGNKFSMTTRPLQPDEDAGESAITDFKRRFVAKEVVLDSFILKCTNDQLREVPQIAKAVALRGGVANASHQR